MNTRTSTAKRADQLVVDDIVDIVSPGCYYGTKLPLYRIKAISRRVSVPTEFSMVIQRLLKDGTEDETYQSRSIFVRESTLVRLPRERQEDDN